MNYLPYAVPPMPAMPPMNMEGTQYVSLVDPYVVETLESVKGKDVVIETVRGSITGEVKDVKPDHVVIQPSKGDNVFFIRIQQIVSIMPLD